MMRTQAEKDRRATEGRERAIYQERRAAGLCGKCGDKLEEGEVSCAKCSAYRRQFQKPPPEYFVWAAMKARCLKPNHPSWANYGGRGITVCDRWRNNFQTFLDDMGPRPSPLHSLDRINNDDNYEPENCRWTTRREQQQNRRNNCLVTVGDRTQCLSTWSRETGIPVHVIRWRLDAGWEHGEAVSKPIHRPTEESRSRKPKKRQPRTSTCPIQPIEQVVLGPHFVDLTGNRYGKDDCILVVRCIGKRGQNFMWECQCNCGSPPFLVQGGHLRNDETRSCGCLSIEPGKSNRTHGMSRTPEYRIWAGMKQRCLNPNKDNYADYGGRGITVSKEWVESFATFLSDMGPRPSAKHTLDRIDSNGNYEKSNCRWATWAEQGCNRRQRQR